MSARFIYVTTDGAAEAAAIGRRLVEERLAACANVIERMTSFYWWEGEVQQGDEAVLVLKTTAALVDRVVARVKALHSYDCPCVVAIPITAGNPAFLDWIEAETQAD